MSLPKAIQKLYEKDSSAKIVSNSMFPKLNIGQKVRIIPNAKMRFGDILIWHSKDKIIAHRFYFKINGHFVTKGDNNRKFDIPWDKKKYIGKIDVEIEFKEKVRMLWFILKALPRSVVRLISRGFILKY